MENVQTRILSLRQHDLTQISLRNLSFNRNACAEFVEECRQQRQHQQYDQPRQESHNAQDKHECREQVLRLRQQLGNQVGAPGNLASGAL